MTKSQPAEAQNLPSINPEYIFSSFVLSAVRSSP